MKNLFNENIEDKQILYRPEKNLFSDYDKFVEKFQRKKTTDDCYTPKPIFDTVLKFVSKNFNLDEYEIIRPFYPDKCYEDLIYKSNQIVIDNPPFSIISQIARFFIKNEIKFFLFAPHLTLFSNNLDCCHVVCDSTITYENGAIIKTSFLTNIFSEKILVSKTLREMLISAQHKKEAVSLPKFNYPKHVITVSKLSKLFKYLKKDFAIKNDSLFFIKELEGQKRYNKKIFGGGYLCSDKVIEEIEEIEGVEEIEEIVFYLSQREKEIIKELE